METEAPITTQTLQEPPQPESQPNVSPLAPGAEPELDDSAVRAAIAKAEAENVDPESLRLSDLSQGKPQETAPAAPAAKPDVPEKFLKPDGAVDVEKLQASTRQLDEALEKKDAAVQKTVEDYVREYREKEARFRALPNPERLAATLSTPPPSPEPAPTQYTDQQLEEMINRDIQNNPGRTIAQMLDIALAQRLAPIEQEKKVSAVRQNIQELANRDPRVLSPEIFSAITAKLESWKTEDPARLQLKNPHKAAWLEVKEEMRLGEPTKSAPAQPSKTPSPVLGGGTPPSTPSSSAPRNVDQLSQLDPRDKKQEALGDELIRSMLR